MKLAKTQFFILILLFSLHSLGESVQGTIERDPSGVLIKIKRQRYNIHSSHPIDQILKKLDTGDLISAQGKIDKSSDSIRITQINFVGLRRLLGSWYTENQDIFNFINYSELELYTQKIARALVSNKTPIHNYKYSMVPSKGETWSLFVIDRKKVTVGTLRFVHDQIEINLLNQKTGEVGRRLKLTPIPSHAFK